VTWYVVQSLPIIVLAVVLGILVGWLWWGRQWRRVRFSQSDAVTLLTEQHRDELAHRDRTIASHRETLAARDELISRFQDDGSVAGSESIRQPDTSGGNNDSRGEIGRLSALLAERDAAVVARDASLADRDSLIAGKDAALADLDALLSERDSLLASRESEIERLSRLMAAAEAAATGHRHMQTAQLAALAEKDAEITRLTTARSASVPATPAASASDTAAATPDSEQTAEVETAAFAAAMDDELQRIEGIGPRIAAALRRSGIRRYTDLADADEQTLRRALGVAGLSFAPSLTTWSRQARLLAGCDEAGFEALAERLTAGREKPPSSGSLPVQGAGADRAATSDTIESPTLLDVAAVEARTANGAPASDRAASDRAASDGAGSDTAPADGGTADDEGAAETDDLERIEGIGPRIGAALREADIRTFQQLADADITTLQAALERAGLRFAPSLPTWSRQARLLADGDEAGFIALTEQFVAGRDVSRNA
jgi:predicted flap endonuclease-1-like 5' DNA nuclease